MSDTQTLPQPSNDSVPPRRSIRPAMIGFIGGLVGGAVIAGVVAAAIIVSWPTLKAQIAPPTKNYDATLGDLEHRVAMLQNAASAAANERTLLMDLAKRVAALEQATHAAPVEDPHIAALADKVDRLAGQVATLRPQSEAETDMQSLVARAEVAAQTARSAAAQRESSGALLVVVGQLRDAVERGGPYASELAAARKVAPDNAKAALDALAATADTGVTPRADLINSFPAVASAIARVAFVGSVAQGFWGHLEQEAATLVTVRRVDGQGMDPASVAARAEKDVRAGDLEGALKELATLAGPPATEAREWVAAARARVDAEHALSALTALAGAAVKPAAGG